MSFLQIQGLAKRFGSAVIFEDLSFAIDKGEFVAIIGHSGCGKTTILNILAGLDTASGGVVINQPWARIDPAGRGGNAGAGSTPERQTGHVACTQCGTRLPLQTYERDDLPSGSQRRGLYVDCRDCALQVTTSVSALTLALPQGRAFRRMHPRLRAMPPREVEAHGGRALVVGYEAVGGDARLDAIFRAESLRLLEVHGPSLTAA